MTIAELIEELSKVENKNATLLFDDPEGNGPFVITTSEVTPDRKENVYILSVY